MAGMRKDVRARLVAIGTKAVHIAMFLAIPPMLALPTDAGAAARQDFARALVPKAAAFLMPPFPAAGDASSADVVTSQGVARIGADALQAPASAARASGSRCSTRRSGRRRGSTRSRGRSCLRSRASTAMSFDTDTGIAGRDFNGNTSRHGEFVTEIVYDIAPDAEYWLVNYHTPDQFKQAVDYLRDVVHPNIVVHSNSFLFGPLRRHGLLRAAGGRASPRRGRSG